MLISRSSLGDFPIFLEEQYKISPISKWYTDSAGSRWEMDQLPRRRTPQSHITLILSAWEHGEFSSNCSACIILGRESEDQWGAVKRTQTVAVEVSFSEIPKGMKHSQRASSVTNQSPELSLSPWVKAPGLKEGMGDGKSSLSLKLGNSKVTVLIKTDRGATLQACWGHWRRCLGQAGHCEMMGCWEHSLFLW